MADWATFAGLVAVVCLVLLALSHLTERALTPASGPDTDARGSARPDGATRAASPPAEPTSDSVAIARSRTDAVDRSQPDAVARSRTDAVDRSRTDPADQPGTDAGDRTGTDADDGRTAAERPIRASRAPRPPEPAESIAAGPDRPPGAPVDRDAGSEPITAPAASPGSDAHARGGRGDAAAARIDGQSLSTGALLANVAATQGLFAAVLIGAAIYTGIPADALGLAFTREYLVSGLAAGTAAGLVLYAANEIGAALADRSGIDHSEELRGMLAPDTLRGWLVLLLFVLPLIALFEELLFRAALIGVVSTGFGVSPWALAIVSSIVFALGHGIQGTAGVVVTGALGFVLAAIFVWSGSLLVVVIAHYVINAFEFVVHEGFEIEWAESIGG